MPENCNESVNSITPLENYVEPNYWSTFSREKKDRLNKYFDYIDRQNMSENFKVLRVIYGLSLLLGLNKLVENGPFDFSRWMSGGYDWRFVSLYLLGSVTIFFLSIRLFWAIGNIRRDLRMKIVDHICKHDELSLSTDDEKNAMRPVDWARMMLVDVPVLLLHSFILFLLCSNWLIVAEFALEPGDKPFNIVLIFLSTYSGILLFNAFWLMSLRSGRRKTHPESYWVGNNLGFGIVGLAFVVFIVEGAIMPVWACVAACFAFLLNSLIDFLRTGWTYSVGQPG